MSWTERSASPRPDSIPQGVDAFIAPKRREARAHWLRVARDLPPGGRVLEVGAGSCLVSRWIRAARPDLDLLATDCGDYPVEAAALNGVRFVPRTAMESLPFAADTFDAVISQFGFEYAERDRALGECARVLRPGGRLAFLMHSASGPLHQGCALRVRAAQMILAPPAIPDLLWKLADAGDPRLRSAMAALSVGPELRRRSVALDQMEQAAGIAVPSLRDFLQGATLRLNDPALRQWLKGAAEDFALVRFVGEQQLRAALSAADVAALSEQALRLGLTAYEPGLSDIAWRWGASKPGGQPPPRRSGPRRVGSAP